MVRKETIETVVVYAGMKDCKHEYVQGENEIVSESVTRMFLICSGCLREEVRTRTFTFEPDLKSYLELKKLDKTQANAYAKSDG